MWQAWIVTDLKRTDMLSSKVSKSVIRSTVWGLGCNPTGRALCAAAPIQSQSQLLLGPSPTTTIDCMWGQTPRKQPPAVHGRLGLVCGTACRFSRRLDRFDAALWPPVECPSSFYTPPLTWLAGSIPASSTAALRMVQCIHKAACWPSRMQVMRVPLHSISHTCMLTYRCWACLWPGGPGCRSVPPQCCPRGCGAGGCS